jgi:hypothetical protein
MKRPQIQLDERTYETLRRRAFERGCSISALIRELLAHSLEASRTKRRSTIKDFSCIGAGRSRQERISPVSERHDEALGEALLKELRK